MKEEGKMNVECLLRYSINGLKLIKAEIAMVEKGNIPVKISRILCRITN